LGVIGAFALIGITPLLVERMLKIPSELIEEARSTFYLLALSVPVILISGSLGGVLEATQRFDLFNIVRIIASSFSYILPLLGMLLGFGLPGIVGLIFLARIGALIAFAMISLSLIPELRRYSGSFSLFPRLFSFGGWVMVSSIISPLLVYLDRFLIGSLLSMSAVAYYSAPYEIVTRLVIIPASLTKTLFPAFSALEGVEDKQRLGVLFARSIKYLLIALGPLVLLIGLLARSILQIWLGVDFAKESTLILQILSFGVLINSLALIPFTLLQGIGRPDLPAKFHLLELSIYVGTAWLLISQWGITGAAAAWAFRVALDALLLFGASLKVNRFPSGVFTNSGTMLAGLVLLLFSVVAYGVKILTHTLPLFIQGVLLATIFAIFAWFIWIKILDMSDKGTILKAVKIAEVLVHKSPF
jgi:O-antigen/teichoic acid export membrane protein